MTTNRLSLLAALLLTLPSCGGEKCTADVDCTTTLEVVFADYGDWELGSYTVTAEGYGSCELFNESGASGCRDESFFFTEEGWLIVRDDPETVRVVIQKDGEPFKDAVVKPDYELPEPECFPRCRRGRHIIE